MQYPKINLSIGILRFVHGFTVGVFPNYIISWWEKDRRSLTDVQNAGNVINDGSASDMLFHATLAAYLTDRVQAMCSINVRIENSQPGKLNGSSSVVWKTCHEASQRSCPSNA